MITRAAAAAGLALFWGALAGALGTLLLHGAIFSGIGLSLQYAAASALLQALAGLPLALAVWWALELHQRRGRLESVHPLVAVQVTAVALPVALGLLLLANEAFMGKRPALSATGGALALALFAAAALAAAGATVLLSRRAARDAGSWRGLPLAGWLVASLAGGATLSALYVPRADAPAEPRSVLLISIDSVRRDTWERYLAEQASAELRRFVSESRRFHNAYTTWSHSLASHASMLSGLYPFEHGAVLQAGERGTVGSPIAPGVELLASRLSAADYQTGAFISNSWLGPPWGLEAGFGTHVNGGRAGRIDVFSPVLLRSTSLLGPYLRLLERGLRPESHPNTRLLLDWLARRDRSRPFFGFLHFIEMHVPHDPPRAALARVARGRFADLGGREAMRRVEAGEIPAADLPELIAHLHDLGVAMLSEIDRWLVPGLEALRQQGLLEHTLVILTSDHGDNFYEKAGSYSHAHVYDTIARVPLVLHVPGDTAGADSDALVSVVDLAATAYAFTGVDPPGRLSGLDLLGLSSASATRSRSIFVQGGHPDGGHARAIVRDGWKLIDNPEGSRELYELAADPHETRNLSSRDPARAEDLARRLELASSARGEAGAPIGIDELPPDVVEKLRGLGYIE